MQILRHSKIALTMENAPGAQGEHDERAAALAENGGRHGHHGRTVDGRGLTRPGGQIPQPWAARWLTWRSPWWLRQPPQSPESVLAAVRHDLDQLERLLAEDHPRQRLTRPLGSSQQRCSLVSGKTRPSPYRAWRFRLMTSH
jgi:hypothetical protein